MEFIEYPKALYLGDEMRKVENKEQEDEARAAGYAEFVCPTLRISAAPQEDEEQPALLQPLAPAPDGVTPRKPGRPRKAE